MIWTRLFAAHTVLIIARNSAQFCRPDLQTRKFITAAMKQTMRIVKLRIIPYFTISLRDVKGYSENGKENCSAMNFLDFATLRVFFSP